MQEDFPIRSISRSLAVLQAVNRCQSLSMKEIADMVGIPYPTACRIVKTLQFEGMIERESSRKNYRPGARVKSLSFGYREHSQLVLAARRHMESMTREILWPLILSTRLGVHTVVRDSTHDLSPLAAAPASAGVASPLPDTASGLVYLAFTTEEDRRQIFDALGELGWTPARLRTLSDRLGQVRANGYALREKVDGLATATDAGAISVPIHRRGIVHGALTLAYHAKAYAPGEAVERFARHLQGVARDVADSLPYDAVPEHWSDH